MNLKEILQDKALLTKYVVLIFAVLNSVLNLFGVQTIGDSEVNDIASAVSTLASGYLLLSVRAHELKNLKSSDIENNPRKDEN